MLRISGAFSWVGEFFCFLGLHRWQRYYQQESIYTCKRCGRVRD